MNTQTPSEFLSFFGLKKTEARMAVLSVLLSTKKPLSAGMLFESLKKHGIDKVTVYRTLDTLEEKGAIKKVATGEREMKYELVHGGDDHHHVICLKCKKMADFTGCNADALIKKALAQVEGFHSVSHHTFDIFGLCTKCSKV
ncbi:MAG: Fur family transcriptional regulator [Candidatus Paceibacterota bacterium]